MMKTTGIGISKDLLINSTHGLKLHLPRRPKNCANWQLSHSICERDNISKCKKNWRQHKNYFKIFKGFI